MRADPKWPWHFSPVSPAARAVAWSGGSEPKGEINPSVITVMAERGIDLANEYPKPWSDEILPVDDGCIEFGDRGGTSESDDSLKSRPEKMLIRRHLHGHGYKHAKWLGTEDQEVTVTVSFRSDWLRSSSSSSIGPIEGSSPSCSRHTPRTATSNRSSLLHGRSC
jgi:hypothetical protein